MANRQDFLDYADAIQAELANLAQDKKLSGSFRTRERTRIIDRWLRHIYNMGRIDREKEIATNETPIP